jgi:hypothetical protein
MAAIALPAFILAAAACGGDDGAESSSSASAQDVDTINARLSRNEMASAALFLDTLGLHDIDETIAAGEEIPFNAIPAMRKVIRLVNLTEWDSELQADADALKEHAEAFITAAEADDHGALAEEASAVHDGAHDFVEAIWDVVAPGTGGEHADDEGGDDEHSDEETPEATP